MGEAKPPVTQGEKPECSESARGLRTPPPGPTQPPGAPAPAHPPSRTQVLRAGTDSGRAARLEAEAAGLVPSAGPALRGLDSCARRPPAAGGGTRQRPPPASPPRALAFSSGRSRKGPSVDTAGAVGRAFAKRRRGNLLCGPTARQACVRQISPSGLTAQEAQGTLTELCPPWAPSAPGRSCHSTEAHRGSQCLCPSTPSRPRSQRATGTRPSPAQVT